MRISLFVSCVALLLAACQSPSLLPKSGSFAEELAKFDAQPRTEREGAYDERWIRFNNEHRLDEKDNCYSKAPGEVTLVIQVDETGTVRNVATSVENAKAICFKGSYMNVRFPPPPFAPYRQAMDMR